MTDPKGQNPKARRPAVILTKTEELANAGEFVAAAISTQFEYPLPQEQIPLPWSPDGSAETRLTEPCVVKCHWLRVVKREDILRTRGHLPSRVVREILRVLARN